MEAAVLRTACMFIEPLQDRQLVQRLKLRDPNAMMDLYDSYARLLYSIILRAVNDSALAEDLTQEAFFASGIVSAPSIKKRAICKVGSLRSLETAPSITCGLSGTRRTFRLSALQTSSAPGCLPQKNDPLINTSVVYGSESRPVALHRIHPPEVRSRSDHPPSSQGPGRMEV